MRNIISLSGACLLSVKLLSQSPSLNEIDNVQVPWEQQMATLYQNVDLSAVTTHVLLDRGIPMCQVDDFSSGTTDNTKACTFTLWQNLYGTLFSSAWQSQYRLPDPQTAYLNTANAVTESSPVPLALLAYNYHRIDPEAFQDGLFSIQNDQLYDVPNRPRSPYSLETCFAAAPMLETIHSLQAQFVFQQNLYFSNNGKTISSIQIDFEDGMGFRTAQWNIPLTVQYTSAGVKYLLTRINYSDNSSIENYTKLYVDAPVVSATGRYSAIFQSFNFLGTRQFNGSVGGALVTVSLGCGNTKLVKPLIVIEGFDPPQRPYADQNHYLQFLNSLTTSLVDISGNTVVLGSDLENQGYDLVFVDFHNGGDYIQRSAYLVEEIIQWVNAQLIANGSSNQNVVWGVSNGGLIARYALREMEMMGIPHNTRQYVAFDSPQQGANFPLGFQKMVYNVANMEIYGHNFDVWQPQLRTAVDILDNPAAKQALVYHASSFPLVTPERAVLMNWFNTNGYPLQCERVVVSNGSNAGISEPFSPGEHLMNLVGAVDFMDYEFDVYAVPDQNAGFQTIYHGHYKVHVWILNILVIDVTTQVSGTLPYDSAPGGIISLSGMGVDLSFLQGATGTQYFQTFEVIQVEADEKDKGDETGDYHREFFAAMREAAAYRAGGKRDVALQKFEDILIWVQPAERPWTEYWVCLTKTELNVLTNVIHKEEFVAAVQECIPLNLTPPAALRLAGDESEDEDNITSDQPGLSVYPNPANDQLTIEVSGSSAIPMSFELYSTTGQLVRTESLSRSSITTITVADLEAGLYFYRVTSEGDKARQGRVLITH